VSESYDRVDALFRRYNDRLVKLAAGLARDWHTGEDIAQETWALVVRDVHQLQADDDHAFAWIASIARRTAAGWYRLRRNSECPMDWSDPITAGILAASPAADVLDVAATGLSPMLAAAVDCLPDLQRLALLYRADGMSYDAIAARLGVSKRCIQDHHQHGVRVVAELLGAYGAGAEEETKPTPLPIRDPGASNPPLPGPRPPADRVAFAGLADLALAG
jgi:RNA polymerase sigma factor (sigma-70 family)